MKSKCYLVLFSTSLSEIGLSNQLDIFLRRSCLTDEDNSSNIALLYSLQDFCKPFYLLYQRVSRLISWILAYGHTIPGLE